MKRFTKKIVSAVIALTLVFAMSISAMAATTWHSYLANSIETAAWEGAAAGFVKKNTSNGFIVSMSERVGWGGVWSCQMDQKLSTTKGTYYALSFKAKSSNVQKYIYCKISKGEDLARGLWVKLRKGKTETVSDVFKAGASADQVTFGLGGDAGDRVAIEDGKVRYALFDKQFKQGKFDYTHLGDSREKNQPYWKLSDCNGDFSAVTDIEVKDFKLVKAAKKVSFKAKAKGKKKVKVTMKKGAGIAKFEVKVGKVKKNTSSTSITVKAKKKGKQKVKVRGLSKDKSYKTKWATKKVKVK